MTSWTHPSSTTSTKPTQIAPLPGDAAVRAVDPGHQETSVGEGVMSRNNLHHQSNQPPTPTHNHQSTNHEHLQSLTTTIHSPQSLTSWSQGCMAHYTGRCPPVCPSILELVPTCGNASLLTVILYILLPVHSSLSLLCWKPCLSYVE